jgi:hypothetical protein
MLLRWTALSLAESECSFSRCDDDIGLQQLALALEQRATERKAARNRTTTARGLLCYCLKRSDRLPNGQILADTLLYSVFDTRLERNPHDRRVRSPSRRFRRPNSTTRGTPSWLYGD